MNHSPHLSTALAAAFAILIGPGCAAPKPAPFATPNADAREEAFVRREFLPLRGEVWTGSGVAYGPHRDGQFPGGPSPMRDELRQDAELMSQRWGLVRVYGAVGPAETLLEIIEDEGIDLQVVLGVWISVEEKRDAQGVVERLEEARSANRAEVESAVRLVRAFPDIILAVSVGNETQVSWSDHRVPPELLVDYVREVRSRTRTPVTVGDDFNFWNKPESQTVARELDFLFVHAHPLWNGIQLEDALDWTKRILAEVQAVHTGHPLVLGETGWATQRHSEGEQAQLMRGVTGEAQQRDFYNAVTAWSKQERVPTFFFEAFDENWKGGKHPDEVEKHWGLFRADRTPKAAMTETR